jgi:hypothetical protein
MVMTVNGMKLIFPVHGKTDITSFAQAMKFAAIIPAARLLTEIPAKCALITQLGTGNFGCSSGKAGVFVDNDRVVADFGDCRQGSDENTAVSRFLDADQIF